MCRFHGVAAKHVRAAARARLDNAADRMAQQLLGLALAADSESVQLGATNSALDRVGIVKPTEVVLSQGEPKPWEEVYEDIAGGSREESRAARDYVPEGELPSSTSDYAATPTSTQHPAYASETTFSHVGDADSRPSDARSGVAADARDASYAAQRAERLREAQAYQTLHEAAQLTRARVAEEQQLALESRHRRYRQHRR